MALAIIVLILCSPIKMALSSAQHKSCYVNPQSALPGCCLGYYGGIEIVSGLDQGSGKVAGVGVGDKEFQVFGDRGVRCDHQRLDLRCYQSLVPG